MLFDIDGTLVDTGGAGGRALRSALLEEFDLTHRAHEFPALDLGGSTDSGVVQFLFGHFDIAIDPESVERYYRRYHGHLRHQLRTWGRRHGRILPGVSRLIDRLHRHQPTSERHALGLLTGNVARGAWTKVASYGLDGVFGFGAFGDDHHDRNKLGPVAIDRAEHHLGKRFEPSRVFIIGDTPKDIRCARACGAWAIAVATGGFTIEQLAEHSPDVIFENFEDTDGFVEKIERLAAI